MLKGDHGTVVTSTREHLTTMPRIPMWQRILDDIRADIESGRLAPGDRLPSQRELREAYRCSEQPVKRALAILEALGYTEGQQGVAVYVRARPPPQTQR